MAAPPEQIGPYRILRKIGEGGMGAVYEGVHSLIERKVAIKILHLEYASQPEFIARFFNEARAVNRVDHAGLVQISDYGQMPDGTAYIVMEFLSGESLASRLKRVAGPLTLDLALNICSQLADALAAAHEKNVVHRDLKPDNVMLVADAKAPGGERTKLLDFGIAKLSEESLPGIGPGHVKTSTNSLMGTPYYMSPEQCRGAGKVDGRSDVYALGVMLYEMLCGVRPITGEGQGDIIVKHITEEPTPLRARIPELPEAVAVLVQRMMIKDRDKRPAMHEVAIELEALSAQFPAPSTRRSTANIPIVSGTPTGPTGLLTGTGTAAGQRTQPARGRNIGLAVSAATALFLLGGLGVRALRRPAASHIAVVTPSAPQTVRWSIDSTPPGAKIVLFEGGGVLGSTPWSTERPVAPGTLKLKLQLPGYADKELELSQSADASQRETLLSLPEAAPTPTPTPAAPVPSGKRGEPGKAGKLAAKAPGSAARPKKGKALTKASPSKGRREIED